MNVVSLVLACAALLAGVAAIRFTPPPLSLVFAAGCLAFSAYALLVPERAQKLVARLKGLRWRRSEFCRGWLITGDTGSGKTTSGINQLAWQVFTHEPIWGGLCIDEKGVYWETLVAAAQSTTSLIPPLGADKAKVLTLNLRNRIIFRAADEADALQSADFLGKRKVIKRSWGFSGGKKNRSYHEVEEHRIKPHLLRKLRDHDVFWCIVRRVLVE